MSVIHNKNAGIYRGEKKTEKKQIIRISQKSAVNCRKSRNVRNVTGQTHNRILENEALISFLKIIFFMIKRA